MFPGAYFGHPYFGAAYWPGGLAEHLKPDVICYDLIIDGVTAEIKTDGVFATVAVERDIAQIIVDGVSASMIVDRDRCEIEIMECDD